MVLIAQFEGFSDPLAKLHIQLLSTGIVNVIDNGLSSHLQLLSIVAGGCMALRDSLNVQTTETLISKVTANRPSRRRSTYTLLAAVLSIAALAIDSPLIARGQATSGAISGFVTDNVGAAIPQAKVSVKDEGTNVVTEATTDGSGFYNVTTSHRRELYGHSNGKRIQDFLQAAHFIANRFGYKGGCTSRSGHGDPRGDRHCGASGSQDGEDRCRSSAGAARN